MKKNNFMRNRSLMSASFGIAFLMLFFTNSTQAQTDFWVEDFTLPFGTKVDNGITAWSTVAPVGCGVCPPDFEVDGNRFKIFAYGTEGVWTSEEIDITTQYDVSVRINAVETGTLDAGDYINFYYVLDGGPEVPFAVNGLNTGDFTNIVASQTGLTGSTLQIVVRGQTDDLGTRIYFDNVTISGTFSPLPFDDIVLELGENSFDSRLLSWDMNLSSKVTEIHLERSFNGIAWESINSQFGPFSSPVHSFVDEERYESGEMTYYRVRGLDSEGEEGFSNVVSASSATPNISKFYPNPTTGLLHYVLPEEGFVISIATLQGEQILFNESNAALGTLNLNDAPSGVYILKAIKEDQTVMERIVVE